MLSGLKENYDERHLKRANKEAENYGLKLETVQVQTRRLDSILKEANLKNIDFCSIDVEGAELAVVKSIDFDSVNIYCFVIENNYRTRDVYRFLTKKGYKKIKGLY